MNIKQNLKQDFDLGSFYFQSEKPDCMVMQINPELAKEMLKTSIGNRKLRQWYIDLIAAAMKRGEWRFTSNGIGFDIYGNCRDGHHRLHGIIKSSVTIDAVVVLGMPVDSYEVIDTGIMRSYSDRLNLPRNVADVLRLGCQFVLSTSKPTIDQMKPIIDSGLLKAVQVLIETCRSKTKYYSSAPMKLAACVTLMSGANADFVLKQYKALCFEDFKQMSESAHALVRQVNSGKAVATNVRETIARGLRVFDENKQNISKIQISENSQDWAIKFVKMVIVESAKKMESKF